MSLQANKIVKNFGGVKALKGVSFDVRPGEIHALCGENGAGKSTLMKILAGHYAWGSFMGSLEIDGAEQKFVDLESSRRAGISIVFQELSLVPDLTVEENLNLGREAVRRLGILDHGALRASAIQALQQVGLKVDLSCEVGSLSVGVQQLIEIAKAVVTKPRFLILDEPTSALSETEIQHLLKLIRSFADSGIGCVLISHKLNEVFQVSDRVTVLRDGESVGTYSRHELSESSLVQKMVGREVQTLFPSRHRKLGDVILKVRGLTVPNPKNSERNLVEDMSFEIRKGEIVGVSGLMGAGRSEAVLGLLGGLKRAPGLQVELNGRPVFFESTSDWVGAGIVIATEDRKRTGLALQMSIQENLSLSSLVRFAKAGFVKQQSEMADCLSVVRDLGVKCESLAEPVKNLSGGNQQKVVLGKCLMSRPKVIILDEPTRGIDVGAKAEIYKLIAQLSDQGMGLLLISSELPELIGLCDRVLVMGEGRLRGAFAYPALDPNHLMEAAIGLRKDSSLAEGPGV